MIESTYGLRRFPVEDMPGRWDLFVEPDADAEECMLAVVCAGTDAQRRMMQEVESWSDGRIARLAGLTLSASVGQETINALRERFVEWLGAVDLYPAVTSAEAAWELWWQDQ